MILFCLCAHYAWFWCRGPVGLFQAVRAPPRFLPRSRARPFLLWGQWPGSFVPLPGLGSLTPCRRACPRKLAWRAEGAAQGRAGGGAPLAVVWGVQGRALSNVRPPVLEACGRGPLPTGCGCWGCERGDPSPTPQRALLRSFFARCGGGRRAPGGERGFCLGVGRPGLGALPRSTACSGGVRPGPATHWLWGGGATWGPLTNLTARAVASWLCAVWGRHGGAREGGALALVWGVRGWALCHARPPVLRACSRGLLPTGCGCGGCGCGDPSPTPRHALLRSGFARCGGGTRERGGGLLPGCGASGIGCCPTPHPPSLGRAAGARYPLAAGAGDVGLGTSHQPHSARSCDLACRAVGAARGRQGGGVSWLGVVCPGLGALPRPTARPWGVRPGLATHWLWVPGVWAWGPVTNPTARDLAIWHCALWGRHKGTRTRGGLLPGCGASGVGGSATPDRPSLGCAAGARYSLAVAEGGPDVGTTHQPQNARCWELVLRAVGAARGRSGGGGRLLPGCGASEVGRSPTPGRRSWGVRPGPATHWLRVRGMWVWGPVTNPTARALASWLCPLWGRHEGAGGGASLAFVSGVRGWVLTHAPPPILGRAAGARYPVAAGAGGVGLGTRHQPHSARSCELALRAVGAARGCPGGVVSWLGVVCPGFGRSSTPERPSLRRAAGTRYPLAVGAGAVGVGTRHQPLSVRSCDLALRAVGAARGRPEGGGGLLSGCGASGIGHSATPDRPFLGRAARARYSPAVGGGGVDLGTPHQPHSARCCELALCAVGTARGCQGGGASCLGVGRPGLGALRPQSPVFGSCGQGPLPAGCGCGGCGCVDPSPTPKRALLRAGLARCGGGMRERGERRLLPGCGASGVGCSPTPDRPSLRRAAGARYPLAAGAGNVGMGTRHQPHSARSCELACRAVGAARGRPGGGVSRLGVLCPGLGALPRPTARPWGVRPRPATHWLWVRGMWVWGPVTNPTARALVIWLCALWGRHKGARGKGRLLPGCGESGVGCCPKPHPPSLGLAAGARYPLVGGAGDVGMGTCHQPHSARSCELACRAVGAARGRPGGGVSWLGVVCPGLGALPRPTARRWGVRLGPATHWLWVRGMWVWRPVTNPTAGALAIWLCALWGRHKGARGGGGASLAWVWGVRNSALSQARPPFLEASGWGSIPTGCGCGGRGPGDFSPTPHRAPLRFGGGTRAPGRGRLSPGCGASGLGHSPRPHGQSLGRAASAGYPLAVGAGGVGVGTRHRPHSVRSCELALRAVGATRGHSGGGAPLAWVWGVLGLALSHARPSVLGACGPGPLPTGCGCGVQAWRPGRPWHLLPCRGSSCYVRASRVCCTRWPLFLGTCPCAVVVAGGVPHWRASWPRVDAPRLVRSGGSRCFVRLSRRRGALPHPGGCRPRIYWTAARGTWRPAANRAHCACRWTLPRQGRWACSAVYPLGAPRWGCPWLIPHASVLGCVCCGGLPV